MALCTSFLCRDQRREWNYASLESTGSHALSKGCFLNDTSAPPRTHDTRQEHRGAKANAPPQGTDCMKPNGKTPASV